MMRIFLYLSILIAFILLLLGNSWKIKKIQVNPLVLFIWLLVVIYLSIIFVSPYFLFLLFISIFLTKLFVSSSLWGRFMKYSLYTALFIFLFNLLLVQYGSHVIVEWHFIRITVESLVFAYSMCLRLFVIMAAFAIFNSAVSLESLFSILEKLKIPQNTLITLALSLRFYHVLSRDATEIVDAFRVRGLPISNGNLRERIAARYPVMVALLGNSLERGIDMAQALEVRGFPSKKRRSWYTLNMHPRDLLSTSLIFLSFLLATGYLYFYGYKIFPELQIPSVSELLLFVVISFTLLSVMLSRGDENAYH